MNGEKIISPGPRGHFDLRQEGGGRLALVLSGQVDADSVPLLWHELKQKLADTPVTTLVIDAAGLTHCDSAGLGLLYVLSTGQMTPNVQVTLRGLRPEFQKGLRSFSMEDYQTFQSQQPAKQSVAEEVGTAVLFATRDLKQMVLFIGQAVLALVADRL